jgi:GDP-mannose 4,6-dehydratase
MKILITGITGSGGSYLAEYIVENHPEVKVFGTSRWGSTKTHDNIKHINDKINLIECDLTDLSSVIRTLEYCKPDKIFHLAAHANVRVCFDNPLAVLYNNIFSTANLLEAVKLVCPNTVFQMCSTSEVCGTPLTIPIMENHPLNPCNPYAVSKLASEKLAYSYFKAWNLNIVITRAFCYLNSKRKDLFATSFATQIARIEQGKQKILKHGNTASVRTIMHVKEMSEAYWIASEKCEYGIPYNIGGITPITVKEVLDILISKSKVPIIVEQDKNLLRPSDITNQIPDVSRFYEKTGWEQKISIEDSIQWLLDDCRKDVENEKT